MTRFLFAPFAPLLAFHHASAQTITFNPIIYIGPADKESTISLYWGLSAASAALASSQVVAADLSDNTNTCTGVKVLPSGHLDVSSGTSYCTGGITVSALCSADGAGACAYGGIMRVTKVYQQIGSTSAPMTAAYANAPYFILSGWNSLPMMACASSGTHGMSATITSIPLPFTMGMTFAHVANFTSNQTYGYAVGGTAISNNSAANTLAAQPTGGASVVTETATDATGTSDFTLTHAHRMAVSITSGGATNVWVDGVASTSNPVSTFGTATGTSITWCNASTYNYADIFTSGIYVDPTAISSGVSVTGVSLP